MSVSIVYARYGPQQITDPGTLESLTASISNFADVIVNPQNLTNSKDGFCSLPQPRRGRSQISSSNRLQPAHLLKGHPVDFLRSCQQPERIEDNCRPVSL